MNKLIMVHYKFCLLFLVALVGCGASPSSKRVSVIATEGPEVEVPDATYAYVAGTGYHGYSNSTALTVEGDAGATVDLGDILPCWLMHYEDSAGDSELWVIGHVGVDIVLRTYADFDAAGHVNPASAVVQIASGLPASIQHAALDSASGTLYVLTPAGNVYRATDTNSDGRPDVVAATPFIAATWVPGEPAPVWFDYTDPETGEAHTVPGGRSTAASLLDEPAATAVTLRSTTGPVGRFADTDSDGVADEIVDTTETEVVNPALHGEPLVANQRRITARVSEGASIELQVVDENDQVTSVLASMVADSQFVEFALATGVTEGDRIRLRDVTNDLETEPEIVVAPRILAYTPAEPILLDVDAAATLVIEGDNLGRVQAVALRQHMAKEPLSRSLTYTVAADGKSITVTVPALGDAWEGFGVVVLLQEGGGVAGGGAIADVAEYAMIKIAACKKEAAGGGSSGGRGSPLRSGLVSDHGLNIS